MGAKSFILEWPFLEARQNNFDRFVSLEIVLIPLKCQTHIHKKKKKKK